MKVRFLGHASFLIELNNSKILVDPFIKGNPKASNIDINNIEADYVLLTHGHGDHVADAEEICKRTGATIISNYEICNWFEAKGLSCHALNHGGKFSFDFGIVKYVMATHTSSLPDGSYGGNPGGFVLWTQSESLYIAGDTGLTMDMKLIPMLCPKLDAAILPIGDNFTMGIEEAVMAAEFVECDKVIPCHFDTMPVIAIDKEKAIQAFKEKGKECLFIEIGDTLEV